MTTSPYLHKSAFDLAAGLERSEYSCLELTQSLLDVIHDHADQSIFITVTDELALRQAKASDERRREGRLLSPLDGIPIAWKDLFDIAGEITSAGSIVYKNAPPATQNAVVVEACTKMGLITLGKTNLSEFAYSGLGLNPHFGTPINPHSADTPRAPGGSSAGSAVAVASGIVPIAIGTDTAGSVRVPASFCGIAGFKSSQNRYSGQGVFPLSSSLDSLGIFAKSVDEFIQIDAIMRGKLAAPTSKIDLNALTFWVPDNIVFNDVEPDIISCFEDFTQRLEAKGATILTKPFPLFDKVTDLFSKHGTLTVAEAATYHQDLLNSADADRMDQRVRERMLTATNFTTSDYINLQWARERIQEEAADQLGADLLLFPTVAITAPDLQPLEASDELFIKTNLKALRNTMLGNYIGMPGVSVPIGVDTKAMPVGALVSGLFGHDDRVLAVSRQIQQEL